MKHAKQMIRGVFCVFTAVWMSVLLCGCDAASVLDKIQKVTDSIGKAFSGVSQALGQTKTAISNIKQVFDQPTPTNPTPSTGGGSVSTGRRPSSVPTTPPADAPINQEAIDQGISKIDERIQDLNNLIAGDIPAEHKKTLQGIVQKLQELRSQLDSTKVNGPEFQGKAQELQQKIAQMEQQYKDLVAQSQFVVSSIATISNSVGQLMDRVRNWASSLFGSITGAPPAVTQQPPTNPTNPSNPPTTQNPPSSPSSTGELQTRVVNEAEKLTAFGPDEFPYQEATRGSSGVLGSLGCAQVVSTALINAGILDNTILLTTGVMDALAEKGWVEMSPDNPDPAKRVPPYQAGDVVTWTTTSSSPGQGGEDGHIGIIVENGNSVKAMHNSYNGGNPKPVIADMTDCYPVTRIMRKL